MRDLSCRIASSALVVFFSALPAMAIIEPGWSSVQKLVTVVSTWKGDKGDPVVNRKAAAFIDYNAMSERSLGTAEWQKLNADQKQQFTAALRALMEERYYPRWHRIFSKAKLEHVSDSPSGGDTLVKTNMIVGKKVDVLVWRMTGKGSESKIVSLAIGDNDLLNKLKSRLSEKLSKSGFPALLSWMQAKAKQQSGAELESSSEAVIGESK